MAWLVGCLLLAGLVSAGIIVAVGDDRPGEAVVSATANRSGTVDVTSTFTVPIPVTSRPAPTTTLRTTTTLSPAAVGVLRAIASTTTTTSPPATTTTTSPPATATTVTPTTNVRPPTSPTTVAPNPPTTSTTLAPRISLRIVNGHPQPLVVTVNGRQFLLGIGETVSVNDLDVKPNGDEVVVRTSTDDECGTRENGAFFELGVAYEVKVSPGEVMCTSFVRPKVDITPL